MKISSHVSTLIFGAWLGASMGGKKLFINTSFEIFSPFRQVSQRNFKKKKKLATHPLLEHNFVTFSAAFFCKQAVTHQQADSWFGKHVSLDMKRCERGGRAGQKHNSSSVSCIALWNKWFPETNMSWCFSYNFNKMACTSIQCCCSHRPGIFKFNSM